LTKPFIVVQLSDSHIGANWTRGDPAARWWAAIESVAGLDDRADAVLVSGDLAEHGADGEYAIVSSALEALDVPTYVLPGNHDDRAALRAHFGLGGEAEEPVRYAVEAGAIRIAVLDTTKPGQDSGQLEGDQLDWLDAELSDAPDRTTLLAMHHPPFATGMRAWDAIGLDPADRAALSDVIRRHPTRSRRSWPVASPSPPRARMSRHAPASRATSSTCSTSRPHSPSTPYAATMSSPTSNR